MSKTITDQVRPALRAVARREVYFTKRGVVHEVLRRAQIAEAVIEIRRAYRGRGLDEAVLGFIDMEVGKGLRARDGNGLRVYESYTVEGGDRRWRLLREMGTRDLASVIAEATALRDRLDEKVRAYQIILSMMERRGAGKVAEVYDEAWATIVGAGVDVSVVA